MEMMMVEKEINVEDVEKNEKDIELKDQVV